MIVSKWSTINCGPRLGKWENHKCHREFWQQYLTQQTNMTAELFSLVQNFIILNLLHTHFSSLRTEQEKLWLFAVESPSQSRVWKWPRSWWRKVKKTVFQARHLRCRTSLVLSKTGSKHRERGREKKTRHDLRPLALEKFFLPLPLWTFCRNYVLAIENNDGPG